MGPKKAPSGTKPTSTVSKTVAPSRTKAPVKAPVKATTTKKEIPAKPAKPVVKTTGNATVASKKTTSATRVTNHSSSKTLAGKTKTPGKEASQKKSVPAEAAAVEVAEEKATFVECPLKQLNGVLMQDVGDKIKNSGRWPLVLDPSELAVTFLKYRNSNYVNVLDTNMMGVEVLRQALMGAIRFGKLFVLDMGDINLSDANMLKLNETRFNAIQPNLYQELISKDILKNDRYLSLVRPNDGDEYSQQNFIDFYAEKFMMVMVSKLGEAPPERMRNFYAIKIISN